MYFTDHYVVDWDKVQSLDDVKRILKALSPAWEPDCKAVNGISDLVRLERKGSPIAVMD